MSIELATMLERLAADQQARIDEITTGYAEICTLVKSAFESHSQDKPKARRLLNEALDIEVELTVDSVLDELAEEWGVDFERDR